MSMGPNRELLGRGNALVLPSANTSAGAPEPPDREIARELIARFTHHVEKPGAWAVHVLRNSPDDVEARLGMCDAIKRRLASARDLDAKVERSGQRYLVRRGSSKSARRYQVAFYGSVAPGEWSCDCADFLRNSLGMCKHVVFAERALTTPSEAKAGESNGADGGRAKKPLRSLPLPLLDWNPVRPWTGPDEAWSRLFLRAFVPRTEAHWNKIHDDLFRPYSDVVSAEPFYLHVQKLVDRLLADDPDSVSPAALAVIAELGENLERRATFSANAKAAAPYVTRTKRTLFAYQKEGVARLLHEGRLLLGDDMGLGKTTQVVTAAAALFASGGIKRALVVVPAALKSQWQREWLEVSDVPVVLVDGGPEERAKLISRARHGILIMNYEQVVRDAERIRQWAPDLMALDEAQRIKNWETKTSVVMKSMQPRYRWVMTGTPFENRLDELASLVEWVDDAALNPKWRLDCFHAERADGTTTVVGAKNLSTLRSRIEHCVVRRTRAEVLTQLPERTDVQRAVPMTDAQRDGHDAHTSDIAALIAIRKRRPLTRAEFLLLMKLLNLQRMYCNAAVLPDDAEAWEAFRDASPIAALPAIGSPKLEEFRELVRELAIVQGQKVAVFSQWRRMLKWAHWAVRDLLVDANLEAAFFTGAERETRRRENVIRFHDDPSLRILFLSDAGGVGLNLQHAASVLINLEFPWNPAVLEQRIGRVHRMGQKSRAQIYLLSSSDGIESRIVGLVGDKKALFRGLFDAPDDSVSFERAGTFLSRLQSALPVAANQSEEAATASEEAREEADVDGDALSPGTTSAAGEEAHLTEDSTLIDDALPELEVEPKPSVERPNAHVDHHESGRAASDVIRQSFPKAPSAEAAAELLGQIKMHRLPDGGLRIDAPPESAELLAALFRGCADMLSARGK